MSIVAGVLGGEEVGKKRWEEATCEGCIGPVGGESEWEMRVGGGGMDFVAMQVG